MHPIFVMRPFSTSLKGAIVLSFFRKNHQNVPILSCALYFHDMHSRHSRYSEPLDVVLFNREKKSKYRVFEISLSMCHSESRSGNCSFLIVLKLLKILHSSANSFPLGKEKHFKTPKRTTLLQDVPAICAFKQK